MCFGLLGAKRGPGLGPHTTTLHSASLPPSFGLSISVTWFCPARLREDLPVLSPPAPPLSLGGYSLFFFGQGEALELCRVSTVLFFFDTIFYLIPFFSIYGNDVRRISLKGAVSSHIPDGNLPKREWLCAASCLVSYCLGAWAGLSYRGVIYLSNLHREFSSFFRRGNE